jgi:integrase
MLEEYRLWQDQLKERVGDIWQETDLVFTRVDGKYFIPDTLSWWFAKFIKRSGLPEVTLHSLRHTHATLLIADGTDIVTVSKRLGHANTSVTLDVYAHAIASRDRLAADRIDQLLAV